MDLKIKRATKRVELCLDLGLREKWEAAEADLRDARNDPMISGQQTMGGGPLVDMARRVEEVEQEMAAATVTFVLEGLPRHAWSDAVTEHPPRPGDDGDKQLGFNEETIFDALIPLSVVAVVGPDGDPVEWSADSWMALADEMTTRQYQEFKQAVFELNVGGAGARLPKSSAASRVMRRSEGS